MSRRTPWTVAVLVAAGACLTACVQVPDTGPVVEAKDGVQVTPIDNPYNNPPPPKPGTSAAGIVSGFLDAMTATPLQTRVAVKYLTTTAASAWKPQNGGVVAYTGLGPLPHGTATVRTRLRGADRIGPSGQWLGPVGRADSRLSFPTRKENGEWRIAAAPNALLVPRTFYEQTFQDAALYYFDPTGRILVPEVVHMPQGQQLTTALVHALLLGPQPSLDRVVRTFLPPGLTVAPLVVSKGSVDVTLTGPDPGLLSRRTTRLMLSQLSWTLRQDPTVTTFSLSISGRQVTDASGASTFRVDSPDTDNDPAVPLASSQLYALRRGRLVSGQANHLTPVDGPFGTSVEGIGPFAVSLDDDQVAATTPGSLLVGPVRSGAQPTQVLTGHGLLPPAWDFANRLWDVQNRADGGAVVLYVSHGRAHAVRVGGVTGEDVRRFLVSRDGSRLVAVLRGTHRDRIVVSRLRYDGSGRVVSGSRARPIPWASGASARVRDIGWMSPTTIAVLDQVSRAQAEVRLLDVDGSMSPAEVHAIVVQGQALSLATSPASASLTPPFAVLPGALFNFAQVDTNTQQAITGLHHITYAG